MKVLFILLIYVTTGQQDGPPTPIKQQANKVMSEEVPTFVAGPTNYVPTDDTPLITTRTPPTKPDHCGFCACCK